MCEIGFVEAAISGALNDYQTRYMEASTVLDLHCTVDD